MSVLLRFPFDNERIFNGIEGFGNLLIIINKFHIFFCIYGRFFF